MLDLDDVGLTAYFDDQFFNSNPEYWRRMGRRPDVAGRRVIDLGSGVGAMSVELAQQGADVLGIELHEERVSFAERHAAARFPDLPGRIEFRNADLAAVTERDAFDFVISKDTFEHVDDMQGMLAFLAGVLRPGGEIWTGFSPMWFSPNGDHGLTDSRLPWAHLLYPRKRVFERMTAKTGRKITSLQDVDLNGMSPPEFREYVAQAGLDISEVRYNAGDKLGLRAMSVARRIPGLERYFTAGVYAVIRRPT